MGVYAQIIEDLHTFMATNWTASPVAYDNVETAIEAGPWIRVTVSPATADPVCLGHDKIRVEGQIIVQIFVPVGRGSKPAYSLADDVAALLQNRKIGSVLHTRTAEVLRLGDDGLGWYQVNVLIPFYTE